MGKVSRYGVPERPEKAPARSALGSEAPARKSPQKNITCHDCGKDFKGHPSSKYCSFCSSDDLRIYKRERAQQDALLEAERLRANSRIDRLEDMLRSRGLHLSQNRDSR